jgi:hypothetical protein
VKTIPLKPSTDERLPKMWIIHMKKILFDNKNGMDKPWEHFDT